MRFAIAAFGLAAVVSAGSKSYDDKPDVPVGPHYAPPANTTVPPVFTTKVVTEYTTYCPEPTAIVHNNITYTVTEATTLTITDCPCTLSVPVYTTATPTTTPVWTSPVWETPVSSATPPAPYYPSKNVTTVAPPPPPTGTGAYTPPAGTSPIAPPGYTGAATKATFSIAGVLAAAGLIAAL